MNIEYKFFNNTFLASQIQHRSGYVLTFGSVASSILLGLGNLISTVFVFIINKKAQIFLLLLMIIGVPFAYNYNRGN